MRTVRYALAGLAIAMAGATAASGATWTPVAGSVAGRPVDAVRDGPGRVLVASLDGRRRVIITTIARRRVVARQVVSPTARGFVRNLRVLALPRGAALALWGDNGGFVSAYRREGRARFGPAQVVARIPGVASGGARAPAVTVAPDGEVLVAWWSGGGGGHLAIQATTFLPGGGWRAPIDLSREAPPELVPWPSPSPRAPTAASASCGSSRPSPPRNPVGNR